TSPQPASQQDSLNRFIAGDPPLINDKLVVEITRTESEKAPVEFRWGDKSLERNVGTGTGAREAPQNSSFFAPVLEHI
ncbi:hypothetical protein CEXT_112821, partial [Caerostris extrusa]